MRIKTKLNLSVGLLCAAILVLTIVSSFFVFSIKKDTQNILTANYNTLEYSRNMLLALDNIPADENGVSEFEKNLNKQMSNITEAGEDAATGNIKQSFALLKADPGNAALKGQIRQDIFRIMKLNMDAIKVKSDVANSTAESGNLWISVTGCLCFLIAFNLLVNLPNNIANPIKELTESIRGIANKNYSERVHFEEHNEFGDLARSFNTMAEKLEEYNNSNLYKLSLEKKRLETLINNMHDPVIGLDNDGKILFANEEALKIAGLRDSDVLGKPIVELAKSNDLIRNIAAVEANSQPKLMKIFADGKESYFEKERVAITIIPTGEADAVDAGTVILLRNVTPFKELDFAKTNFIATVSHELKTPISSIKLSLKLLENRGTGTVNEAQRQLIDSIREDGDRLLKITGELLDLSQLETGKIQLDIAESDPYKIVEYAVEAARTQAEQKHIALQVECAQNLPGVKADAEKTSWVLVNFLTNAIRYSSEGSEVVIRVNQDEGKVRFEVKDAGKGIDERYTARVFDKYFQVPGSHKTGTGLGLAISKEFIEAQGGSVGVESRLGMGSRFYFCLDRV